ncbi:MULTISPECIES: hypothetical protein [Psychrobacter]|uniref:hypothetical protein n=1 Tax=Psychrobacter TaxID=497 RepID=UPI001865BD2C|nr:hypothetical protein [Psychrobacter aquimaris]MBE8610768.1 hypothetical protein [Pseudomonas lundensis]
MSNSTSGNMKGGDTSTKIKPRPFISRQHPLNDPKDPFTAAKVNKELVDRLALKTYPDQGTSSLCGPATLFYCLLIDHPKLYKQAVAELWKDGKTSINQLNIKPFDARKAEELFQPDDITLRVSAIDWMTLAGLRDSWNSILCYDSPLKQVAGITTPGEIKDWFRLAGYRVKDAYYAPSVKNFIEINNYVKDSKYHVISLVDSRIISTQNKAFFVYPNHWIVWKDALRTSNKPITDNLTYSDNVSFKLFSWGDPNMSTHADLSYVKFSAYITTTIIIEK